MASTPEAVKEVLVKKSADYAGRQQTYAFQAATLGRLKNFQSARFSFYSRYFCSFFFRVKYINLSNVHRFICVQYISVTYVHRYMKVTI